MTAAPQPPGIRVGKACPPFAFTSVQGEVINSKEILARKAVVLFFSHSPLPPALAQQCDELARRYPDDLTLVLITASPPVGLPYPVTADEGGELARTFGQQEPYEGFFVRRDGLVTRHARGSQHDPLLTDPDAFERLIVAMIG